MQVEMASIRTGKIHVPYILCVFYEVSLAYFSNDDDDDEEWERWLEECRNNDRLQDEMRERARQKREKKKILYDLAEAEKRILHTQLLEVYMKRMDNLKKATRAT